MLEGHNTAPSPKVEHLPTIFRRIKTGDIRIPAFQRDFVWEESQILKLLESVYRGYPIGSILWWKVDSKLLKIDHSGKYPFPDIEVKYPINFVLDGLQRLATLYGCFHFEGSDTEHKFNVVFDLETDEFMHYKTETTKYSLLPLSYIFNPKYFLNFQDKLFLNNANEELIDKSIKLHSIFQEYLIPIVSIKGRSINEVVEIFERINSTGTTLSKVDFLRAITWAEDFDLNKELNKLQEYFENKNFAIPAETLIKLMIITMKKLPSSDAMLELREYSAEGLKKAINSMNKDLDRVIEFLKIELHIYSYDFVPYEGQLLVLYKFFSYTRQYDKNQIDSLTKWFWATSFNEELRGKPDHYIFRILNSIDQLINNNFKPFIRRINLTNYDFLERRFLKGKALTSAVVNMFAENKAKSIFTGETIDPSMFMSEFENSNFQGFFSKNTIEKISSKKIVSKLIFANIFLVIGKERQIFKKLGEAEFIEYLKQNINTISSQFLDETSIEHLENGNHLDFLTHRSKLMFSKAAILSS